MSEAELQVCWKAWRRERTARYLELHFDRAARKTAAGAQMLQMVLRTMRGDHEACGIHPLRKWQKYAE
jgi:hypothetical protein